MQGSKTPSYIVGRGFMYLTFANCTTVLSSSGKSGSILGK